MFNQSFIYKLLDVAVFVVVAIVLVYRLVSTYKVFTDVLLND